MKWEFTRASLVFLPPGTNPIPRGKTRKGGRWVFLQLTGLGGWIRATAEDVEQTFKLVPEIKDLNLSISTSSQMINGKFLGSKNEEDILMMAVAAIDAARAHGADSVGINAE